MNSRRPGILSVAIRNGTWGPNLPICGDGFTEADAREYCVGEDNAGLARFKLVPSVNASLSQTTMSCESGSCTNTLLTQGCTSGTIIGLECTYVDLGILKESNSSVPPLDRATPAREQPARARGVAAVYSLNRNSWRYLSEGTLPSEGGNRTADNICRLLGFPAGAATHGEATATTSAIAHKDYRPSGSVTITVTEYGSLLDCDDELNSLNGCKTIRDTYIADVDQGVRIECSRVRFRLLGPEGTAAEGSALSHPLAAVATGALHADRFLEPLPEGCADVSGESAGWGGTSATSGPVCDQRMDYVTADRICRWMNFDGASSVTTGVDVSQHGGGSSFPVGAPACPASADTPEDCGIQTMSGTTGASRSSNSTGACSLPDDAMEGADLPSGCDSTSGVNLTCTRSLEVRLMPEESGGYPQEQYSSYYRRAHFDGVAMVRVRGYMQHRVCAAAVDLNGDDGQLIGDAICRSAGFSHGAWAGSVRVSHGPAVYSNAVPSGIRVRSCAKNASSMEECDYSLLQPSTSWWETDDSCSRRGLVAVRVSCQDRSFALMRYHKQAAGESKVLSPQAASNGTGMVLPYYGLLAWSTGMDDGEDNPLVCESYLPNDDEIRLACQELGFSGAQGTFQVRDVADFSYYYSWRDSAGMGRPEKPLSCPTDSNVSSLGDCLDSESCSTGDAVALQCATPAVELMVGNESVLQARLAIAAGDAGGGHTIRGAWGPVCFALGSALDQSYADGICEAMGLSSPAVAFDNPQQLDMVPTTVRNFTAKALRCSNGTCSADGYFESGWERDPVVGCSVVQIQCQEGLGAFVPFSGPPIDDDDDDGSSSGGGSSGGGSSGGGSSGGGSSGGGSSGGGSSGGGSSGGGSSGGGSSGGGTGDDDDGGSSSGGGSTGGGSSGGSSSGGSTGDDDDGSSSGGGSSGGSSSGGSTGDDDDGSSSGGGSSGGGSSGGSSSGGSTGDDDDGSSSGGGSGDVNDRNTADDNDNPQDSIGDDDQGDDSGVSHDDKTPGTGDGSGDGIQPPGQVPGSGEDGDDGLSAGAIAGIAVGAIAVVAIVGGATVFFLAGGSLMLSGAAPATSMAPMVASQGAASTSKPTLLNAYSADGQFKSINPLKSAAPDASSAEHGAAGFV